MIDTLLPLEKIGTRIIRGGYLVSLISPAFLLSAIILLDLPASPVALAVAYLIPLIIYSFDYRSEPGPDGEDIAKKSDRRQGKTYAPALALYPAALLVLSIRYFNVGFVVFSLFLVASGIAYTLWLKSLTRLVPGFKNFFCRRHLGLRRPAVHQILLFA